MDWLRGCFKSMTLWFNGVMAGVILYWPEIVATLPQFREYLGDEAYKSLTLIVLVGNALLRAKTKTSLTEKGQVQ